MTGLFEPTGRLIDPRENQTATLLDDGRVLIVGGDTSCGRGECATVDTAELYDPAAGTFAATGSAHYARADGTATLLPDGRVLVAGGDDDNGDSIARAEIYNPVTGQFALTGSMNVARSGQTATLLPNGKVLLAGGSKDSAKPELTSYGGLLVAGKVLASAEIYDPATGKFTLTGSMTTARWGHTATLLANGMVLVAGGGHVWGDVPNAVSSAELYDPSSGKFHRTGSMTIPRTFCTATMLLDGRVLLLEGDPAADPEATTSSAELYEP